MRKLAIEKVGYVCNEKTGAMKGFKIGNIKGCSLIYPGPYEFGGWTYDELYYYATHGYISINGGISIREVDLTTAIPQLSFTRIKSMSIAEVILLITKELEMYLFEENNSYLRESVDLVVREILSYCNCVKKSYVICNMSNNTLKTINNNELHVDLELFDGHDWSEYEIVVCRGVNDDY